MTWQEDYDLFIQVARADWYVTRSGRRLHWADPAQFTDEIRAEIAQEWAILVPVRLACGRTAADLWIPGVFTRMGGMRCTGCCRATGLPAGKGSPKNDDACRKILGLDDDEEEEEEAAEQ